MVNYHENRVQFDIPRGFEFGNENRKGLIGILNLVLRTYTDIRLSAIFVSLFPKFFTIDSIEH